MPCNMSSWTMLLNSALWNSRWLSATSFYVIRFENHARFYLMIKYADLNYAGVNKTDKMATIVINLSGAQVLIHEEKMLYPFVCLFWSLICFKFITHNLFQSVIFKSQLLSDVGGAAGLILGLNVFMLVQFCGKWFGFLVNNICIRQLNFITLDSYVDFKDFSKNRFDKNILKYFSKASKALLCFWFLPLS